jgi:dienelactone hydrolase
VGEPTGCEVIGARLRQYAYSAGVVALAIVIVAACSSSPHVSPPTIAADTPVTTRFGPPTSVSSVQVVSTSPPAGFSAPAAQWLRITRADGKQQLAAVYRPNDSGAHPLIVVLHGASGVAPWQLAWSATLAEKGYIVVAGCLLDAAVGSALGSFLRCPGLPDCVARGNAGRRGDCVADARPAYTAILDAAVDLKGVDPRAVGVVGMSLGAYLALSQQDSRVKAIVADSGYRNTPGTTVGPVLLLGFTNDPIVPHSEVVAFERAQREEGNPVESKYYRGASHLVLLAPSTTNDATTRAVAFLRRHVG